MLASRSASCKSHDPHNSHQPLNGKNGAKQDERGVVLYDSAVKALGYVHHQRDHLDGLLHQRLDDPSLLVPAGATGMTR
jgi:hypothetical protein